MAIELNLIRVDGGFESYRLWGKAIDVPASVRFTSRTAYAAAHVVLDPLRTGDPMLAPVIDWEATIRFREHLWSLGFGVAEAMDTSQRGMGLDWTLALELIERSARAAAAAKATIASGAGTDHLDLNGALTLDDVARAYELQCAAIEAAGSRIILMASRALAKIARGADDYAAVYSRVLRQVKEPVILHWLGPMFDPALEGYWGSGDLRTAMASCVRVIEEHRDKIDGVKVSLLDAELEIAMRRALPAGVRMYTGDDFNYDRLILGDERGHSDALLGIFDAIAPAAALALKLLDGGDEAGYRALMAPTVPLSRHIFERPTFYYKTGLVFLAYLNGFQSHFRMVGGQESARSVPHLCKLFRLADAAGLLRDPEMAAQRMRLVLRLAGVA
ncbi:MAG: dihydrodipicolinate synthase family protein [Edaphobacter sp.]